MIHANKKQHLPSLIKISIGLFLLLAGNIQVAAMDFMEKRECTIGRHHVRRSIPAASYRAG